jgi:ribose transport system substrate-binding protein
MSEEELVSEELQDALELDRRGLLKLAGMLGLGVAGSGIGATVARGATASAESAAALNKTFGWAIAVQAPFFEQQMTRYMRKLLKQNGWGLVTQSEEGSAAKAQQIMSSFIANNYYAMARADGAPPKPFEPLAAQARKNGQLWLNHAVQAVGGAGQNIVFDHAAAGDGIGRAAVAWAKKNGISQPVVGMLANIPDPEGKKRTDYALRAVKKAFPNTKFAGQVYSVDQPQTGATATANLLQAHPDINMILTFNTVSGKGAVQAANEAGKTDPKTFFIGMADAEDETLKEVASGTSICQANWGAFFQFSAVLMCKDALKFSSGGKVMPTRRVGGQALVNKATVDKYNKATNDPLAPSSAWVYKDKSIVAYSPIALKTGQSVNSIFKVA